MKAVKLLLFLCVFSFFNTENAKAQYITYQDTSILVSGSDNEIDFVNLNTSNNQCIFSGDLGYSSNALTYSITDFGGNHIKDTIFNVDTSSYTVSYINKSIYRNNHLYAEIDMFNNNPPYQEVNVVTNYNLSSSAMSAFQLTSSSSLYIDNMVKTKDGNLVMVGRLLAGNGQALSIIKATPGGSVMWSKFFGGNSVNPLNLEGVSILQKEDSSFVVLSNNDYSNYYATFISHIDKNGNMISTDTITANTMNFTQEFNPISMTKSTDNNIIYILGTVNDTAGSGYSQNDKLAVLKYNMYNQSIVWAKYYQSPWDALDGIQVNTAEIALADNHHLRIFSSISPALGDGGSYISLMQLDTSGNFINAHTYWQSSYSGDNNLVNFINTPSDNGALIGGGLYTASGFINYTVKTDDQLNSKCNGHDSTLTFVPAAATLQAGAFTFDSSGTFNASTATVPINYTNTNLSAGSVCKCNITISGTVSINSSPADSIKIYGYKYDTVPHMWKLADSAITDINGNYTIQYMPEGKVIIEAKPIKSTDTNVATSFYKDTTTSVWKWQGATVINTTCGTQYNNYNIPMINYTVAANDTNEASGYVLKGYNYNRYHSKQVGDPIPGIDVVVVKKPSGIVAGGTNTDGSGYYHFSHLATGQNYAIWCVVPGVPYDSTYAINFTAGVNSFDSLNFFVDSDHIYLPTPAGIEGPMYAHSNNINLVLYPNPVKQTLNTKFYLQTPTNVAISLTDVAGKVLLDKSFGKMETGEHFEEINLGNTIPPGFYILKVKAGNDSFVKKLIKQ